MLTRQLIALVAGASLALVTACSDDHSHGDAGHIHDGGGAANTPEQHGCDHTKFGPFSNVTPGADRATAKSLSQMTASKVKLEAKKDGWVKFTTKDKGVFNLFTDTARLTLTLHDMNGKAITPTKTATSVTQCTDVKGQWSFDLALGVEVFAKLLIDNATEVRLTLVQPLSGMSHDGGMHHGDSGMKHGDSGMKHGDSGMKHGDGGMKPGDGAMHQGG